MLRIRQDQRAALFGAMHDDYREKVLTYLCERFAARVAEVGKEAFAQQVGDALERARAHGVAIAWIGLRAPAWCPRARLARERFTACSK